MRGSAVERAGRVRGIGPVPGLVGDHDRAERREQRPRHRVGRDHDHPRHLGAGEHGGNGVRREGEREVTAAVAGEDGEPRLGAGEYLDWQQNCPAKAGRVGHQTWEHGVRNRIMEGLS